MVAMLWVRPCLAKTLSSISAISSQLACWGVVDFQAVDEEGFGLLWRKDLVKRSRGVRIEIVHDTEHAGRFQLRLPYVL